MFFLLIFGFVLRPASGENVLTHVEYDRLPKLLAIEEYASCMRAPGDVYCTVAAELRGDPADPFYRLLVEYSANTLTHYNHTKLYRGICPKRTCSQHMDSSSNLTLVVEACLNETLGARYGLTAEVTRALCEEFPGGPAGWDEGDWAFGAVLLLLLALNLLGTLYDFFCQHERNTLCGRALLCFSVRGSWRRLVEPPSSRPMQRRVRIINSLRTITSCAVILGHSPIPGLFASNNYKIIEDSYHNIMYQVLYNGSMVVQTFFFISGFLLAYNQMLNEEKRPTAWWDLPKGVLLRWLRFTPPYALLLAFVVTWARHMSEGPFSQWAVTSESLECQRDWWWHMLYINNYKDHSECMVHTWYLAADFQLRVVGLVVLVAAQGVRARRLAVATLAAAGLLALALQVFLQDLYPVLVISPEVILNFFVDDPTFNNLYKRGHTNLLCYALGMALALAVYALKETDLGARRFKHYRWVYWLLFPLMVGTVASGAFLYAAGAGARAPLAARAAYAPAVKLVHGALLALFMLFTILKVDETLRGALHWGGWARLARLSYGAYLLHVPLLRLAVGNSDELFPIGLYWLVQNYLWCVLLSFLLAVPLFVLVESPLMELVRVATTPAPTPATDNCTKSLDEDSSKAPDVPEGHEDQKARL